MEESTKKKIHQFEIMAAILLLLISVVTFFPKPGITGFVSVETKKQKIDLSIANSQSYILTTNSYEPMYLTSLKISGNVIGDGIAKAYIATKDQKILIYSNTFKEGGGLGSITGMKEITGNVIGVDAEQQTESDLIIEHLENIELELDIDQDETPSSGTFDNICRDSCFIEILLQEGIAYQLLFYVEEGTILNINELIYTIRKD